MTTKGQENKRREEYLESEEPFRKKARQIIAEMANLYFEAPDKTQEDISVLVDEILHSIFFLGKIHDPPFSPESILKCGSNGNLFEKMRSGYPGPFKLCSSQLPRRSPFSCVLDMMVHLYGQENEEEIRKELQQFVSKVEKGVPSELLISNTMCVSHKKDDAGRYYGVSMSTSGPNAGRIMVAASCLSFWDDYVANAVMTYYPKKSKKEYFDGTIKIPDCVKCQAFKVRDGTEMNPCRSCGNMFGLNTNETREWPYGNCAEAESLSKLLKNETTVKEKTRHKSDMWTKKHKESQKWCSSGT